jgi:hypothetical protein
MTILALACTGTGCLRGATAPADRADAAVTTRESRLVTRPATWQNLWGSWPFARYYHSMAYDSDRKVMVMYGGQSAANGPYYDDTWEWDGARGVWNEKTPASNGTTMNSPPQRTQQLMVYDTVQKKMFLFSGWQPQAGFYIPDQWEWDGTTWKERVVAGAMPKARYGGTMVWDSDRNRAVLFGGFCSDNSNPAARCNDVWEWDGTGAGTWTNRTPAASATQPSPRMYHAAVYDAGRKKMVVFGGYTGTGTAATGSYVDETWEWDGATATWTKVTPASGKSIPYYTSGYINLIYDAGRGKVIAYYYQPYMYEYDPVTPQWTQITTTKTDPDTPPYNAEAFAYDSTRAQIVLFGGYYGSTRDLWELDGTTGMWTNRSVPTNGPIQRQYPSTAYDSKRGKLMLFGGYSSTDGLVKQDTWEWSGTDSSWINRTNANAKPVGRQQGAMVYDSERDQLLLWGGSGTGVTNDLWSWSPTTRNWTMLTVNGAAPSNSYNVPMFYDPVRDKLELYINYYTYYEFDLATSTWTNRYDSKNPPPAAFYNRSYAEVTYDTDRSKMLFVGGYGTQAGATTAGYDADVWEWDPATNVFTERTPPAAGPNPPGRNQHGVSYDSSRRAVVMFAGYGQVTGVATGPLDDSWEWDGIAGTWTETTPPGVKPLPRYNHIQIFDSMKATTLVFGGVVSGDSTYGPQEIWEYLANSSPRPNGSGCSAASAASCASGNCVDGVCCAVPASQCAGTCMACNVAGKLGTCSTVPVGLTDDTCPSDQACDASQKCKKPLGQQCGAFDECASGHCADGVCCNTDCNDTCKVCNLATSRGTCSFVPSGNEDPNGAPACISSETQGRSCDGAGTCSNLAKPAGKPCTAGGQCASGFCIDGVCCNSQCANTCYQCDRVGVVGSCYPVLSGGIDHSATTPCDGAGQSCNGSGTCTTGKKANGATCTAAADCTSNYCVDGICCVSACTGTCQSCAVPGSLGACVNLPAGSQDSNSSPACNGSSYCDAAGTCQTGSKPNGLKCTAASECGSGYCVDGVCCVNACTGACLTCNGDTPGTCGGERTGFADPACPANQFCNADHACTMGKKPNGAVCGSDIECGSSYCIDGTCCESICTGDCRTCANATGTCQLAADGTDPRMKCKGTGTGSAAVCGGTCNGAGACRWTAAGTPCSTAGCQSDGFIKAAGTCDGAGNCPAAVTMDCGGFACTTDPTTQMAKCLTDCTKDPECTLKNYCAPAGTDGGTKSTCPVRFDLGHACLRNTQCNSNTCSDGVCCDKNCDKCGSCNTPGKEGTCIPIPAGTDPEKECQSNASDPMGKCAGLCNGQAACQYPLAGTSCGLCAACDGSGLCNQLPPSKDDSACGTIDCSGLNTMACRQYSDLTANRCDSVGACKTKNTVKACTIFTDNCSPDGGTPGAGGSSGGGPGGSTGTGTAGSGGGGRGGTTGTDGGPDAGKGGGGGGGCGCEIGGTQPGSLAALLALVGVMIARRRRR